MFDEINEYLRKHEEKCREEKKMMKPLDDAYYKKCIDRVKVSNQRLRDILYENDPDEAINRLSTELSLKNDLGMRLMQSILNKYNKDENSLSDNEKQTLIKFLSEIPIFNDKITDEIYNTDTFKKLWESVHLLLFKRGQYMYRKGQPIDHIYFIIKGDVLKVEEQWLDLKYVL